MEEIIELKFPCGRGDCRAHSTKKCSNCLKISYCSIEHQKEDWVNHKAKCRQFPIQYKRINDGGKNILIAAKKIDSGQLIFQETSLISGPFLRLLHSMKIPSSGEYNLKPTCLSCYKEINPNNQYSCSNCQWAVCDSTCEKEKIHADFECKIFAQKNIKPPLALKTEVTEDGRDIYSMITVLRALLLRDSNPDKWNQILNLYSYPILRQINPWRQTFQKLVIKFIQKTCGLLEFDENTIKRIGGIISFNARGNDVKHDYWMASLEPRTASFLFHDLSHLTMEDGKPSNCTIHAIQMNKFEVEVEVYARWTIKAGEKLNYTNRSQFKVIDTNPPVPLRSATSSRQKCTGGLKKAKEMFDEQISQIYFCDNAMAESCVRQLLDFNNDGPNNLIN